MVLGQSSTGLEPLALPRCAPKLLNMCYCWLHQFVDPGIGKIGQLLDGRHPSSFKQQDWT